jgi:hypothetical protein
MAEFADDCQLPNEERTFARRSGLEKGLVLHLSNVAVRVNEKNFGPLFDFSDLGEKTKSRESNTKRPKRARVPNKIF